MARTGENQSRGPAGFGGIALLPLNNIGRLSPCSEVSAAQPFMNRTTYVSPLSSVEKRKSLAIPGPPCSRPPATDDARIMNMNCTNEMAYPPILIPEDFMVRSAAAIF